MRPHIVAVLFCLWATMAVAADNSDIVLRWGERGYVWYYNLSHQPDWLSQEEALDMVRQAAEAWQPCGVTLTYAGISVRRPGEKDGVNVVGWSEDGRAHSAWTSWRAHRDGRAVEADITLYANIFSEYRRRGLDAKLELRKSIIHEFGHVLGLRHSDKLGDAMIVRIRTRPEWQLPSDNDIKVCRELNSGAGVR